MDGIELRNVTKTFPRAHGGGTLTVFKDFNLDIDRGEIVAIVGASGCGKTTLLNVIALLEACDWGDVWIDGKRQSTRDAGKLPVGYLFQRDALLPWKTAWKNALLGLECRRKLSKHAEQIAEEYFERFGLKGFEHAWPHTLSGGQRQRVALVQSLLVNPDYLLLDEPFGSLDYQTKLDMEELLLDVIRPDDDREHRRTVIIVTHDIEEAIVLADRVIVIGSEHSSENNQPSQVILERPIELPDELRNPVSGRQSDEMKEYFPLIWESLRAGVPVDPETKRPLRMIEMR